MEMLVIQKRIRELLGLTEAATSSPEMVLPTFEQSHILLQISQLLTESAGPLLLQVVCLSTVLQRLDEDIRAC